MCQGGTHTQRWWAGAEGRHTCPHRPAAAAPTPSQSSSPLWALSRRQSPHPGARCSRTPAHRRVGGCLPRQRWPPGGGGAWGWQHASRWLVCRSTTASEAASRGARLVLAGDEAYAVQVDDDGPLPHEQAGGVRDGHLLVDGDQVPTGQVQLPDDMMPVHLHASAWCVRARPGPEHLCRAHSWPAQRRTVGQQLQLQSATRPALAGRRSHRDQLRSAAGVDPDPSALTWPSLAWRCRTPVRAAGAGPHCRQVVGASSSSLSENPRLATVYALGSRLARAPSIARREPEAASDRDGSLHALLQPSTLPSCPLASQQSTPSGSSLCLLLT